METALAIGHLGLGAHKMGEKKNYFYPKNIILYTKGIYKQQTNKRLLYHFNKKERTPNDLCTNQKAVTQFIWCAFGSNLKS